MTLTLHFDGGSRGNPGPAGCGWIINQNGNKVSSGSRFLGKNTNNFAEYSGMIDGLKMAVNLGLEELEVYGDSKLVVEQMKGNWKVKAPGLIPLWKEGQELTKKFKVITFNWIRRHKNSEADGLANEAMNRKY